MTRETKSYELKIYDQSLMRFEAAYDAFGSLKLEITDIDSANAHLLPLNLIVDQDEKSLASWMEGRTIPKNRAFVEQILSTAGLTRNDILGILDVSKGLSINDSYWLDDGKSDVTFDEINLFDNRFDEVLGLVAYTGYTPSQKHKAGVSSEWTLGGQFPKVVRISSISTARNTPVRRAGLPTVFVRSSLLRRSIGRAAACEAESQLHCFFRQF